MSKPAIDHRDRLDALNGKLSNLDMRGYWQLRHDSERMEPKLWRWADIYPALMETADVVRMGADAFRRNVSLQTGSRTLPWDFKSCFPEK
jgi:gentisate 1,2-dioxygenase